MVIVKPKITKQFRNLAIIKPNQFEFKDLSCDYSQQEADESKKNNLLTELLANSTAKLIKSQQHLWTCKKYGVLVILQGMDTSGKDGMIRHVFSGVNPQGCRVESFKVPTLEEHAHNFLWRYQKVIPARGEIAIFNRSYYEDVLAVRVHPENLEELPEEIAVAGNDDFWLSRYEDINAFEKHLARNGILILKFFLNISKNEQKKRLLERLDNPAKQWKVSAADFTERHFWQQYSAAYQAAIAATGQEYAPWLVIPANDKNIARAILAKIVSEAIDELNLNFPQLGTAELANLDQWRKSLLTE